MKLKYPPGKNVLKQNNKDGDDKDYFKPKLKQDGHLIDKGV